MGSKTSKGKRVVSALLAVCMAVVGGVNTFLPAGIQTDISASALEQEDLDALRSYYYAASEAQAKSTTAPKKATTPKTTTAKTYTYAKTTTARSYNYGKTTTTTAKKVTTKTTTAVRYGGTVSTTAKYAKSIPQTTVNVNKMVDDAESGYEEMKAYANRLKEMSDEELAAEGMTPKERDGFLKLFLLGGTAYKVVKFFTDKGKNLNETAKEDKVSIDGDDPVILNEDIGDTAYRTITWTDTDGTLRTHSIEFPVQDYADYASRVHYPTLSGEVLPSVYLNDEYNRKLMRECVKEIQQVCKITKKTSKTEMMYEAIQYVQAIPYKLDSEVYHYDYPQYPVETLYWQHGDCEDTAFLLAGILREMGYNTTLFSLYRTDVEGGHMALGISTKDVTIPNGATVTLDTGESYYFVESTGYGFTVGEIPPSYRDEKGGWVNTTVVKEYPIGK